MKRVLVGSLLVFGAFALRAQDAQPAAAADPAATPVAETAKVCFPLQISIWPEAPEIQVKGRDVPIEGLKLNLISGCTDDVRGFDIGLFSRGTEVRGIQVNAGNYVQEKAMGIQAGIVNGTKDFTGVAIGAVNYWQDGVSTGLSVGLANITGDVTGVQIGLFNLCRRMTGAQIGLINIIQDKKISFYPILNAAW